MFIYLPVWLTAQACRYTLFQSWLWSFGKHIIPDTCHCWGNLKNPVWFFVLFWFLVFVWECSSANMGRHTEVSKDLWMLLLVFHLPWERSSSDHQYAVGPGVSGRLISHVEVSILISQMLSTISLCLFRSLGMHNKHFDYYYLSYPRIVVSGLRIHSVLLQVSHFIWIILAWHSNT